MWLTFYCSAPKGGAKKSSANKKGQPLIHISVDADLPEGDLVIEPLMIDDAHDKRPKTTYQTAEALLTQLFPTEALATRLQLRDQQKEGGLAMAAVARTARIAQTEATQDSAQDHSDDRPAQAAPAAADIPAPSTTATTTVQDAVHATYGDRPMNEFTHFGMLVLLAFPHLFPLGTGIRWLCGPLSVEHRRYIMLQHDWRFAREFSLLFYLHNVQQRAQSARAISLTVEAGKVQQELFTKISNEEGFAEKLQHAVINPTDTESKRLIKQIDKCVSIHGASVDWSPQQRKAVHPKLLGMMQFFGLPSIFLTISPSDMDYGLLLQWTDKQPPTFDPSYRTVSLPLTYERRKILADNPVIAAEIYRRLVEFAVDILLGHPMAKAHKKSMGPTHSREDGMLGKIYAFFGVTEIQGRGSPHAHMTLWTDLGPCTIRQMLNDKASHEMLMSRLDSLITAAIPAEIVEESRDKTKNRSPFPCMDPPNTPRHRDQRVSPEDYEDIDLFIHGGMIAACHMMMHTHADTCHSGKMGHIQCRLSYARAIFDLKTGQYQIEWVQGCKHPRARRQTEPIASDNFDPVTALSDPRTLIIELHRPSNIPQESNHIDEKSPDFYVEFKRPLNTSETNGRVVAHSPFLVATLHSNVNAEFLGSFAQAKAAAYYVVCSLCCTQIIPRGKMPRGKMPRENLCTDFP